MRLVWQAVVGVSVTCWLVARHNVHNASPRKVNQALKRGSVEWREAKIRRASILCSIFDHSIFDHRSPIKESNRIEASADPLELSTGRNRPSFLSYRWGW